MNYTELKCKTNFSFLRGASSSPELIRRAVELGLSGIAISDVNGVYALPRAYEAFLELTEEQKQNFKLITGAELIMQDHPPVTLLAKNKKGYGILCRIITAAHAGKEKGKAVISLAEISAILEEAGYCDELFCLPDLTPLTNLEVLKELFPSTLYLPLGRFLDGQDEERTKHVLQLSEKHELPYVAVNDVHYHTKDRRALQDALTCIREGKNIETAGYLLFSNSERHLKSSAQMSELFQDLPEALANNKIISESCNFSLSELKYTYPAEFIPEGHTAASYLKKVVMECAYQTYKTDTLPTPVLKQIQTELNFFAKRGDEHYFLTVYDIVKFAKDSDIICQGRGSAANSIVCYLLGITSVDPIEMNLLFDRFMNEGRRDPPDIDVDFEHERREEVIQYIYRRFGRHRAAMVAAVRTYQSRSCLIELSKAMGIDVGTISAGELAEKFKELAKEKAPRIKLIQELSQQLEDFPRHISIHSGGFVLSDEPLCNLVPVEPGRMKDRTIIQWDKDDLETLGLMKIDVLSIGFLTALHKATKLAGIDWRTIPSNDEATYKMIQRAETHGTFQIESRAQMNMLGQTLPRNYYDLVVQVALVRPSPTVGGMVQPFIKGLFAARAGKPFKIGNEKLEKILGRTYGVPIFQEQIMQISIEVAGFTAAEADQLRRSLAAHRTADSVDVMGQRLYKSLIENGIPEKFGKALFEYVRGYAHYGFPESHAASYASLAYKSAYMKCKYPAELVCSLINSQPLGFYSDDVLIAEAKRNSGVTFLPLDPNKSVWDCTLEGDRVVRMGFRNLRRIKEADVELMIQARNERPFHSLEDFISRTQFNKELLENLAMADVFRTFGIDRRHSFWQSLEFTNLMAQKSEQMSLFKEKGKMTLDLFELGTESVGGSSGVGVGADAGAGVGAGAESAAGAALRVQKSFSSEKLFAPMNLIEEIQTDHAKLGYSLHGNMMKAIRPKLPWLPKLTSAELKKLPKDRRVSYAGILSILQRPPPAKGTAFITLEDEFGSVDAVLRKDIYEKFEDVIRHSRYLIFTGVIQKRGLGTSLKVESVESFGRGKEEKPIERMQKLTSIKW
jgi:error-prone DNA polymerase